MRISIANRHDESTPTPFEENYKKPPLKDVSSKGAIY
jgi:hypothetical protein